MRVMTEPAILSPTTGSKGADPIAALCGQSGAGPSCQWPISPKGDLI